MSVQTFSAPLSASMLRAATDALKANCAPGPFTTLLHPDVQAKIDGLTFSPQKEIRKKLLANNRKSRKGRKHKGLKWVLTLRAQCAIHGHVENPFCGPTRKCCYCGLKLD